MASIRFARDEDLELLAGIEDDADQRFIERFRPETWDAAPSGRTRAAQGGFLLVAVDDDAVVGFVHVIKGAHLEQLAVRRESGRRGHGRALVLASLAEAARREHEVVTLRTYADVPWNAPFYAALGFRETDPDTEFLRGLVEVERRLGLERFGRRVQMAAATGIGRPR